MGPPSPPTMNGMDRNGDGSLGRMQAQVSLLPFTHRSSFADAQREAAAKQLVAACRKYGFVYVSGHDIPASTVAEVFAQSRRFFSLEQENKDLAPHPPGWAIHRGYSRPGLEKVSNAISQGSWESDSKRARELRQVPDFKESFDIGSEENPEMPNVWLPDAVAANLIPGWKEKMLDFYWACWSTARIVLQAMAFGLGVPEDSFAKETSGHYNQLRLLHYPPVSLEDVETGKLERMPVHSDWSVITMLFQDGCGGLQAEHPEIPGRYVEIEPKEGTLVLNVGDLLQRWSNDYLRSTQHRVSLPSRHGRFADDNDDGMTRARYSIPYFVTTDPDSLIEPLVIGGHDGPGYKPITQREHAAMKAKMQY